MPKYISLAVFAPRGAYVDGGRPTDVAYEDEASNYQPVQCMKMRLY